MITFNSEQFEDDSGSDSSDEDSSLTDHDSISGEDDGEPPPIDIDEFCKIVASACADENEYFGGNYL